MAPTASLNDDNFVLQFLIPCTTTAYAVFILVQRRAIRLGSVPAIIKLPKHPNA